MKAFSMRLLKLAVVGVTLAYSTLGLFSQVFENWRRHTTEGLSDTFGFLVFFTFLLWLIYGIVKKDKVIIIANGPGTVGAAILLLQIIFY